MQQIADIFKSKKDTPKAPAYQWQDLALRIIAELKVPYSKRNSVFKVCKDYDRNVIEKCLDDTKELSHGLGQWRYFFKLISKNKKSS